MSELDRNRANAVAFHELALNECRPREAIEQFVGDEYIQHNPDIPPGKSGVVADFQRMALGYPGKRVEIKRTVAEGGLVVFHCRQTWPGGVEYAGIDIFRFDDADEIVEHWDVLQEVPGTAAHDNGMF